MTRCRRKTVSLKIRLYPGQDDDLIAWLEPLDAQGYGAESRAVKDALRQGIGAETDQRATPVAAQIDLAEVRRAVEAPVASALARFEGQVVGTVAAPLEEDDETEDLLDALGAALVLGGEA